MVPGPGHRPLRLRFARPPNLEKTHPSSHSSRSSTATLPAAIASRRWPAAPPGRAPVPASRPCCSTKCFALASGIPNTSPATHPGSTPPPTAWCAPPPLQLRDLLPDPLQEGPLVQQPGTQQGNLLDRAGYAFAEPQRPRVVLFHIVDRFQRLRP